MVIVDSALISVRKPANELWSELSAFDLFRRFSAEQRDAFLKAFDSETAMRVRQFRRGELVCAKGEFELDLCFILKGSVDLFEINGAVRTKVGAARRRRILRRNGRAGRTAADPGCRRRRRMEPRFSTFPGIA